jgi:hypothetical protein
MYPLTKLVGLSLPLLTLEEAADAVADFLGLPFGWIRD